MSYRYEVEVNDGSPSVWYSNALRFETPQEAEEAAKDHAGRWLLVKRARVVDDTVPTRESVDPEDSRIVVNWA